MYSTFRPATLAALALASLAGCSSTPPTKPEPVDAAGTVVTASGKPVGGVSVLFLPTTDMQSQGGATLKADGKFTTKLVPGLYTFVFEGSPAAMKAIPVSYHLNDASHTFEVPSGGSTAIQIKVGN